MYANASATVRLSGQVDLSQASEGQITFDCIFVVEVDEDMDTDIVVTSERYDATNPDYSW